MVQPPLKPATDLDELSHLVYQHFERNRHRTDFEKRRKLSEHIRRFHRECGTISPSVENALEVMTDEDDYVFLWSAHQPNLFPYIGVVRKIVLMEALKRILNEQFDKKVVCFFAIADNVFPDKWVFKANLPKIDMPEGKTILRMPIEEKNRFLIDGYVPYPYMINRIEKPDRDVFEGWNTVLENWLNDSLVMNSKVLKKMGFKWFWRVKKISSGKFWEVFSELKRLLEECFESCKNFSDFNGFFLSKLVNEKWGYDTLFARISEFNPLMKEKCKEILSDIGRSNGMFKSINSAELGPIRVAPIWYNCDCGGKAFLYLENGDGEIMKGKCANCEKWFRFSTSDLSTGGENGFFENTSFRAPALIYAFNSVFNPNMYVGGTAGWENYYGTIFSVARETGFDLHPIAVWNPTDKYLGTGQLNAVLYAKMRAFPKEIKKRDMILNTKYSILDYLLNMGFKDVSDQFLCHLLSERDLNKEVHMKTILDDLFADDVRFKEVVGLVH